MHQESLKAPYTWFGGKSRVAPLIWERLGTVANYVEPFAGSLAVLLGRPHATGIETINDFDGFVCNVWRALAADPEAVAQWADWPVSECDLHARHLWLRARREVLTARLMGDPMYYDVQIAGWWLWGTACWIGGGWCTAAGRGPWGIHLDEEGYPQYVHLGDAGLGVKRQRPHLSNAGQGVTRQLPHLGNAGQGVKRQRPHLGDAGHGVNRLGADLLPWFRELHARLRLVRVCCGDWTRVMGDSVTHNHGMTGILLDPPYPVEDGRDMRLYHGDSGTVAHDVRAWCLEHGQHPLLRIALCGYAGSHDVMLSHGWTALEWKTAGGMGNQGHGRGRANSAREVIWFSPACLGARAPTLF